MDVETKSAWEVRLPFPLLTILVLQEMIREALGTDYVIVKEVAMGQIRLTLASHFLAYPTISSLKLASQPTGILRPNPRRHPP